MAYNAKEAQSQDNNVLSVLLNGLVAAGLVASNEGGLDRYHNISVIFAAMLSIDGVLFNLYLLFPPISLAPCFSKAMLLGCWRCYWLLEYFFL